MTRPRRPTGAFAHLPDQIVRDKATGLYYAGVVAIKGTKTLQLTWTEKRADALKLKVGGLRAALGALAKRGVDVQVELL